MPFPPPGPGDVLARVHGRESAKRTLEVWAAGGHNILLVGPPATGKTLLSRCLPGILPQRSFEEALETTRVRSVAGLVSEKAPLVRQRPFRSPHRTVSYAGLVGGGCAPTLRGCEPQAQRCALSR